MSDMDYCHTDEGNVLTKLAEVLRCLKSAKHSSTVDKKGFVRALPSLPLGSCPFLSGWAETTGRAGAASASPKTQREATGQALSSKTAEQQKVFVFHIL